MTMFRTAAIALFAAALSTAALAANPAYFPSSWDVNSPAEASAIHVWHSATMVVDSPYFNDTEKAEDRATIRNGWEATFKTSLAIEMESRNYIVAHWNEFSDKMATGCKDMLENTEPKREWLIFGMCLGVSPDTLSPSSK